MLVRSILNRGHAVGQRGLRAGGTVISRWTMPRSHAPVLGIIGALARSTPQLVAENLRLRQQLSVLNRSVKHPDFTPAERGLVVLLASRRQNWTAARLIVTPATVWRWQRQGVRRCWKRKSRATSRDPNIPAETVTLSKERAANNRLWGAERIRGELLNVGITVAQRTVQRSLRQAWPASPHGQTWSTLLRNHAKSIWAGDVLQVHAVVFRPLCACVITALGSRRIVHVSVTRSPTDAWVAQQLRAATPFGAAPTYLMRDNDAKYGWHCDAVAVGTGIAVLRTPIKPPRANAIGERLLGSVRREGLAQVLLMRAAHLRRVRTEDGMDFHRSRPQQGMHQRVPDHADAPRNGHHAGGSVIAFPVVGGLQHDSRRAA